MSVTRRHLEDVGNAAEKGIHPPKLSLSMLRGRYFYETFSMEPSAHTKGSMTEPTATQLVGSVLHTGAYKFEYATIGGEPTDKVAPTLATDGGYQWGVAGNDALGAGFEINFGGNVAGHPRTFLPGSEDWFFRIYFNVDDVSGIDAMVGFREVGAYLDTPSEITDFASLRILGDSSSALGAFSAYTQNASDLTSTAFTNTLTDATSVELEVRIVSNKPRYFVNGVALTNPTYTFASSLRLTPIFRWVQTTDVHASLKTFAAEGGPLADRQPGLLSDLSQVTA